MPVASGPVFPLDPAGVGCTLHGKCPYRNGGRAWDGSHSGQDFQGHRRVGRGHVQGLRRAGTGRRRSPSSPAAGTPSRFTGERSP